MGTITAQQISIRASDITGDDLLVAFPDAVRLRILNDGQRAIAELKPESTAKTVNAACVGGTKQTIPSDGIRALYVVCNMDVGGTVPGFSISQRSMESLNAYSPGWHSATPSNIALVWAYDPEIDPKVFYLSPPRPASGIAPVLMSYSANPVDIAAIGNAINLDDTYANALRDYLLFRMFASELESPSAFAKAQMYWGMFTASLGIRDRIEEAKAPIASTLPVVRS